MRPGEPAFARAVCLDLTEATGAALRTASEIARRAETLRAAAPKVRTKGADAVIHALLNEDAVAASAPGSNLSRWAAIAFAVGMGKPGGFISRRALSPAKVKGVLSRRIVQFTLEDAGPMLWGGELILRDGKPVGEVRSAAYGHTLGRSVADRQPLQAWIGHSWRRVVSRSSWRASASP